jgi:hypothetical protein
MTAAETSDLHSPDLTRVRVVEWQAPGPVAAAAMPMSGIEAMRAIRAVVGGWGGECPLRRPPPAAADG